MASPFTRSSKRSEGLTTRSSSRHNVALPVRHRDANNRQQTPNIGRKKRPRESTEYEEKAIITKKARIAIEIHPQSKPLPKSRSLVIKSSAQLPDPRPTSPPHHTETATQTSPILPTPDLTIHQQKVVNGIKHELGRLQPESADLRDEKRKLRSQEGSRFKSELSLYFPEYDEVIGNEPKEAHILNTDTPIIIIDSAKTFKQPAFQRKSNEHKYPLRDFPDSLFTNLHNAEKIDFPLQDKQKIEEREVDEDPFSDAHFEQIHKKPERQEKTIRNTDKGRAQHEKDQVIRLLEGLQGHDWLKLMGVSGITESKKREYEPAREHFIDGCQAIIEKFRIWREEEKRRKMEKERTQAEAVEVEAKEEEEEQIEDEDEANLSDGDPPDHSDFDASAARQLQEEAIARSGSMLRASEKRARVEVHPSAVQELEKDFKSFFCKPYLRDAALGKHRRSGRSVSAWGYPVPEIDEIDFDLPEEYRDEETLRAHARKKRRFRRVGKN